MEDYVMLAGVVAAHPNKKVVGRTRLQKTIKLLQRLGLPTSYGYSSYFYGPYSEDLQADMSLLDLVGLVEEEEHESAEGNRYYVMEAKKDFLTPEVDALQSQIKVISRANAVVLELAATYDAFRDKGSTHEDALKMLRSKKADKCSEKNVEKALKLLRSLNLPAE